MSETNKQKTVDELTAENQSLKNKVEKLEHEIAILRKAFFGPKSEKNIFAYPAETGEGEQTQLFNEAETESRREETTEDNAVEVTTHKRRKKRSRAEIFGELPVEEVVHEVEDKTCDICGSEMKTIGKEFVHDELVYVPSRMFVRKHYVEVVKCVSCGKDESKDAGLEDVEKERFRKAEAPFMLIPRSFCSPELLAHIIYEKYINANALVQNRAGF